MSAKKESVWSKAFLAAYFILTLLLFTVKFDSSGEVPTSIFGIATDKIIHFLIFLPLPLLMWLYARWNNIEIKPNRAALLFLCIGMAYGIFTESLQNSLSYRDGDIYDLLADSLGTLSGLIVIYALGTHIEKMVRKILIYE